MQQVALRREAVCAYNHDKHSCVVRTASSFHEVCGLISDEHFCQGTDMQAEDVGQVESQNQGRQRQRYLE